MSKVVLLSRVDGCTLIVDHLSIMGFFLFSLSQGGGENNFFLSSSSQSAGLTSLVNYNLFNKKSICFNC